MNRKTRTIIAWLIVVIPATLLAIAIINRQQVATRPTATQGVLNAQNWDWEKNGNLRLDGEWEFYWNHLLAPEDFRRDTVLAPDGYIQVPGIWNGYNLQGNKLKGIGYATFRLKVILPANHELMGLKIITMSNSYKLWVNSNLVASNGKVGTTKEENQPEYQSKIGAFYPGEHETEIVVQVSNFYHWKGGFWHPIKMGTYGNVLSERDGRFILEMFLFGCLMMMAIYHFGAFILRKKDISTLYFGLVCLFIGVRSLLTGENIMSEIVPGMSWFVGRKLEFILTFLSVPAYAAFTHSIYPKQWHKFAFVSILGIGGLLAIGTLVTPCTLYTGGSYIFTLYSFIASLYIVYVFIAATIKKQEDAGLFLATTFFFFITIVNEILNQNEVVHTGLYLPLGLLMVVFVQAFLLNSRSATAFKAAELYAMTFQKFVPKQFLDRIAKQGIGSIRPGNAEKGEVTVIFSDIRSFTSISEKMSPDEVFKMLNEYLSYVEPPIRNNNGFVDKYMGDGIMALFEKDGESSSVNKAIVAVLEMQEALKQYNKIREERGESKLMMGIGVHTGQVIMGTIGGNERMDSTAIGDAVNLSARIEGMTKMYGAEILISGQSLSMLANKSEFLLRFIDYVVAKGKSEPVAIWEVLGRKSDPAMSHGVKLIEQFDLGIQHYRSNNWKEAIEAFEKCLEYKAGDPISMIYIERCKELLNSKEPPRDNITILNEK